MKRFARQAAMVMVLGYLLGIRGGRLALWQDGSERPEQVYDIRADSLPPADRLILEHGIRLETRTEVWQVLENYLE